MKNIQFPKKPEPITEQIKEDRIILNRMGRFPKKLIFLSEFGEKQEYRLEKTPKGNFILKK